MMDEEAPDRVMLSDEATFRYWVERFRVPRDELEEAVETVGDSPAAVAAYLNVDLLQKRG